MTSTSVSPPDDSSTRTKGWSWRAGLLVIAGLLLLRLPVLLHGDSINDETLYSVVASEQMHGAQLYVDVVDRKPPLLYGAYAAVFSVTGINMYAIHVAGVLWTLLTMLGLALAGRGLFGKRTGVMTAILYGIYSCWGPYTNLAWNGELMTNLPIAWALVVVFWRGQSRLRPGLLAAGALLACAFLLKQPGATAAMALGLYLLLPVYRRSRGLSLWHSLLHAGFLCCGFAAILGAMLLHLHAQGALSDAIYWGIRHHDMPRGPTDVIFWERLAVGGLFFALCCYPLLAGSVASLVRNSRAVSWTGIEAERTALLLLLACAMIGVSASGRFYLHYFILLLPGLALAAAPTFVRLREGTAPPGPWPLKPRASQWVLVLSAVVFLAMQAGGLARRKTASEADEYIRSHSAPSDRIFVWGESLNVYLASGRRPASRYVSAFPLTGYPYGGAISYDPPLGDTSARIVPGTWDILDRELSQHPPLFIVDAEAARPRPFYQWKDFPVLARLIEQKYRRVYDARDGVIYQRIP